MSLMHGKAIEAEEIERIVSRQFSPQQFASLCNAITWASSGQRCASLPSFTERVNVADGGIDAELTTEIVPDFQVQSPLIGSGWNVFQYKMRDLSTRKSKAVFTSLKTSVSHAAMKLWERAQRRPDRYILFTNLDLTHLTKSDNAGNPQKGELRASILEGYDHPENVHVEILGAAELAALLNNHPHLRSAYFSTSQFETWERFASRHFTQKQNVFGAKVDVLGRDLLLGQLRGLVDSSTTKVIVLYGPHTIGKTRLAIEATSHHPIETIGALDPLSMTLADLAALASPGTEVIVIIEGPDAKVAERLIEYAISVSGLKLIITLPTSEKAPQLNYGRDPRIHMIQVGPLDDDNSDKLLKAAGAKLDYSLKSWVVQQAGGNPGILLMAAKQGRELRQETINFTNQVATAFEKQVREQLGEKSLEVLSVLSVLTHVGIRGQALSELNALCIIFGKGIDVNSVLTMVPRLQEAGVVNVGGSYVEVVPPIFANALAASTLKGRFSELCTLLAILGRDGAVRLLRRLRSLRTDEVERFWDELFGKEGLFKDFDAALTNSYILRLIAGSVPERVAKLVEPALIVMSLEQRQGIKDHQRRELVWAIEELLYRKRTCGNALRCVFLLAEAESEPRISNNATGVFTDCFHSWHPQFPMPLAERLAFLKSISTPDQTINKSILALQAAAHGLSTTAVTPMHTCDGPEPLDAAPFKTYGDVWDYTAGLASIIVDAATSNIPEVSKAAIDMIPRALTDCAGQTRPRVAVDFFKIAVQLLLERKIPISITELTRSVNNFIEDLLQWKITAQGDQSREFEEHLVQMQDLLRSLEAGDFQIRLKKWVGGWSHDTEQFEIDDGTKKLTLYRDEKEIFELAKEVTLDHSKLTDELIDWLIDPEPAQARSFFHWLGVLDRERRWQGRIEAIGTLNNGKNAFSTYFGGMGRYAPEVASKRLDELTAEDKVISDAIVFATTMLPAGSSSVQRLELLITQQKVDPILVARVCATGWVRTLSVPEFLSLVKVIAGKKLENAGLLFDLFSMWIHCEKSIDGELAEFGWQCLEAAPAVSENDSHDCNMLATKLARMDIDRAFKLLDILLRQPYDRRSWNPVDRYGTKGFWDYLHTTDRKRLLLLVLEYGLEDNSSLIDISWHLCEKLDQVNDRDLLIEFASRGKKEAALVARSITAGKDGFWPIAFGIVECYVGIEPIENELAWSVDPMKGGIIGSYALHIAERRKEVKQKLLENKLSGPARAWLERVDEWLKKKYDDESISEADESANDLHRGQSDEPASPERLWAIKLLVKQGRFRQLKDLFGKDELLNLMPCLSLSAEHREKLKQELESR